MMGDQSDGEVTIIAGGKKISGWTDVSIVGGLEMIPASFSLGMTEKYPGELQGQVLHPGDDCTITIGGDLVLTGYINRVPREISDRSHMVRVEGRSRCQDLVDCSAYFQGLSITNQAVGDVARMLVKQFAGPIGVLTPDGVGDNRNYYLQVSLGETPWEVISQIAAYEGLLVHDDAKGDIVICRVGAAKFASGFTEGVNVQAATVGDSDDMLFSDYIPVLCAQDNTALIGPNGNAAGPVVKDPLVKRFRPLVVISDQQVQGELLAQKRAVWEATRRRGRSASVTLTADSWRDSAGALWTHNVLAPVHLPTLQVDRQEWIVASWQFKRSNASGTTAEITLMPPEAFAVQPSSLNSANFQIAQAVQAAAIGVQTDNSQSITAPNAGANGNVKAGEGHGI